MSETTAPTTEPVQSPVNYDSQVEVTSTNSPYPLQIGKNYTAEPVGTNGGAFIIAADGELTGGTASFTGNFAKDGGAICNNQGQATLSDVTFSANSASGQGGGAIYNDGGTFNVVNGVFDKNLANNSDEGKGGAVSNVSAGLMIFSGATFSGNYAGFAAGAIYVDGATMTFTDSLFTGNSAGTNSGVFRSSQGTVTISGSTFSANAAKSYGVIYTNGGDLFAITDTLFTGNTASEGESCILNSGTMTLSGVTFSGNIDLSATNPCAFYSNPSSSTSLAGEVILATDSDVMRNGMNADMYWDLTGETYGSLSGYQRLKNEGGTLYLKVDVDITTGDSFTIATGDFSKVGAMGTDTFTFSGVQAASAAKITIGGVATYGEQDYLLAVAGDKLTLTAIDIIDQREEIAGGTTSTLQSGCYYICPATDQNGGAFNIAQGGTLTGGTATFFGNTAYNGGAISNLGTINISDVVFSGNIATDATSTGGALYNNNGTVTLTNTTFTGNIAAKGGALLNSYGTVVITGALFADNGSATSSGGALYNNGGTVTLTNTTFTGNTSMNAVLFNNGSSVLLTLAGVTFSGNAGVGAIYNDEGAGAKVILAGEVVLSTESDAIYNSGRIFWDLTGDTAGSLTGYQNLENSGAVAALYLKVDADIATGDSFTIATGDFANVDGKDTFYLTGIGSEEESAITIGGAATYAGQGYMLAVTGDKLTLTAINLVNQRQQIAGGTTSTLQSGYHYICPATGQNGGAFNIAQGGTLTGGTATFAGNTANTGGAISNNGGTVTLNNATFIGNVSTDCGGAIRSAESAGIMEITGSLFAGNIAGSDAGAIVIAGNTATITGSTFAGNTAGQYGGAILNSGTLTLAGVTFTGNTAGQGSGAIRNTGNLILAGEVVLATESDILSNNNNNVYFDLTGETAGSLTGYQYLWNEGSDCKLYLLVDADVTSGDSFTIATGDFTDVAGKDSFLITDDAKELPEKITIGGTAFYNGQGYVLVHVDDELTLHAIDLVNEREEIAGGTASTLQTGAWYICPATDKKGGAIFVAQGGTLTGSGAVFYGNTSSDGTISGSTQSGSAIYNEGLLELSDVAFICNFTGGTNLRGGAISNYYGGTATITGNTFIGNFVEGSAAAVYNHDATLTITESIFIGNYAGKGAAGIKTGCGQADMTLTVTGSTFSGNFGGEDAGAIYGHGGNGEFLAETTITDCTFTGNTAGSGKGGAIVNISNSKFSVADSIFSGNFAGINGGAVYNKSKMNLTGSTFSGNRSENNGGAIACATGGSVTIADCTFTGNTAGNSGGAVSNTKQLNSLSVAIISDSTFTGNCGEYGGAIYNSSIAMVTGSTFADNTSGSNGTVYNGGTMTLADVTFAGNTAAEGGAIYNDQNAVLTLTGEVTLTAESDIIVNAGTISWDLTGETYGCIDGYQNLDNSGTLALIVGSDVVSGAQFTIATGDFTNFTGKASFLITDAGAASPVNITIGSTANYNGQDYMLLNAGNILSLNAVNLVTNRLVVGSGESKDLNDGDAFVGISYEHDGGAVENKGTITGNHVIFRGNSAFGKGGGIFNNGMLTLNEAIFAGNTAYNGGALLNGNTASISNSIFAENSAEGYGGAFYSQGTSTLAHDMFSGNSATYGGAIFVSLGTLNISGSSFVNNIGGTIGGAIENTDTVLITDTVFSGNTVNGEGGAFWNFNLTTISGTTFSGNDAVQGGAIYNGQGNVSLDDVLFSGNTAADGGAIYNCKDCTVTLAGEAILDTASDTFVNSGILAWDLTGGTAGSLTGYQYLSCSGDSAKLTLKVDGSIQAGAAYTLATGDFSVQTGKDTFTITGIESEKEVSVTIGGEAVNYGGLNWSLAISGDVTDGKLELTVAAGKPETRADFNLSGYSDVALVKNKKLSMLYDRVPGTYKKSSTLSNLGKWTLVEPEGDYNGDGRADVLITSKSDGIRTLAGLFNIGVGPQIKFKGHNIFRYKTAQWSYADSGDVNGDKITDIVIVQTAKCAKAMGFKERVVQVKQLNEDGKVGKTVKMGTLNSQWDVVTLADIDGDGTDNVILKNSKSDMVGYWKKAGASLTEIHQAADRSFIATGDFDGDGSDELLWKYDGDGTIWGWDDLASKSITEVNLGKAKAGWSFQQVGDYNGDGREEVLWAAADGRLAYSSTDKLNKLTVIAK